MEIKELKKAVKEYSHINAVGRRGSGICAELYLDTSTGEVWCKEYASNNNWSRYEDPNIVNLGSYIRGDYDTVTEENATEIIRRLTNDRS